MRLPADLVVGGREGRATAFSVVIAIVTATEPVTQRYLARQLDRTRENPFGTNRSEVSSHGVSTRPGVGSHVTTARVAARLAAQRSIIALGSAFVVYWRSSTGGFHDDRSRHPDLGIGS